MKIRAVAILIGVLILCTCVITNDALDGSKYLYMGWDGSLTTHNGKDAVDTSTVQVTSEWAKFGGGALDAVHDDKVYPSPGSDWNSAWSLYDYPVADTIWSFSTWVRYFDESGLHDGLVVQAGYQTDSSTWVEVEIRNLNGVLTGQYEKKLDGNVIDNVSVTLCEMSALHNKDTYIGYHYDPIEGRLFFIVNEAVAMQRITTQRIGVGYGGWFNIYSYHNSVDTNCRLMHDDTIFVYNSALTVADIIEHYYNRTAWEG